jgi:hypothetical protein
MKTNTKKKGNPAKKLIPAAGSLMVSAVMLATSTYAWFTMNREVQVTNMQVKARSEGGLLISETSGHTTSDQWDDIATANNLPTGVVLLPTSSANTQAWYHANSKSANDEAGAATATLSENLSGSYATLSSLATKATAAVSGTNAANTIYFTDTNADGEVDNNENAYYVKYTYFLKASNEQGVSGLALTNGAQSLSIKDVSVTGSSGSVNLDKSLRVGVAIGGKFYIFAPNYSGAGEDVPADYYVYNGSSTTGTNIKITALPANGVAYTDITSIPGVTTDAPVQADVYLWYEGEDPNCKSENITSTLDTLVVSFKFELATNSGAKSLPTDNAKATSAG